MQVPQRRPREARLRHYASGLRHRGVRLKLLEYLLLAEQRRIGLRLFYFAAEIGELERVQPLAILKQAQAIAQDLAGAVIATALRHLADESLKV